MFSLYKKKKKNLINLATKVLTFHLFHSAAAYSNSKVRVVLLTTIIINFYTTKMLGSDSFYRLFLKYQERSFKNY